MSTLGTLADFNTILKTLWDQRQEVINVIRDTKDEDVTKSQKAILAKLDKRYMTLLDQSNGFIFDRERYYQDSGDGW